MAVTILSPLNKQSRPLLRICVPVLKMFKLILVLYEQFNELSSSLASLYRLNPRVKINDSLKTDGKIAVSLACNKRIRCSLKLQLEQQECNI
jgi:hypothetical protein